VVTIKTSTVATEKKLKFKRAKNPGRFSKHNERNFVSFIKLLTKNGTLSITEEGVKFSQVNGYVVFTNYKEGEPYIKTASIFFQGQKGKAVLTLYHGPVLRLADDDVKVTKNTYNVVNAAVSIVPQIQTTIEGWLN